MSWGVGVRGWQGWGLGVWKEIINLFPLLSLLKSFSSFLSNLFLCRKYFSNILIQTHIENWKHFSPHPTHPKQLKHHLYQPCCTKSQQANTFAFEPFCFSQQVLNSFLSMSLDKMAAYIMCHIFAFNMNSILMCLNIQKLINFECLKQGSQNQLSVHFPRSSWQCHHVRHMNLTLSGASTLNVPSYL